MKVRKVSKETDKGKTKSVDSKKVDKKKKKNSKTKIFGSKQAGKKLGLTVRQTWKTLLELNEKAPAPKKMNDTGIAKSMESEFPTHPGKGYDEKYVRHIRQLYNAGGLADPMPPKIQSLEYDKKGQPMPDRRGRPRAS